MRSLELLDNIRTYEHGSLSKIAVVENEDEGV
jgi:hypothetical protein